MKWKFKKYEPVYIKWLDACSQSDGAWKRPKKIMKLLKDGLICHNIGFVLSATKRGITTVGSKGHGPEDDVCHGFFIPKGMVLKIKRLSIK